MHARGPTPPRKAEKVTESPTRRSLVVVIVIVIVIVIVRGGLLPRRVRAAISLDGLSSPAEDAALKTQTGGQEGWTEVDASDATGLASLLSSCSLLVGLHPDQATEPIASCAIKSRKSWACVPCCVFAADSPHRFLPGARPVATHEDLCSYLENLGNGVARHDGERVQRARLNFKGKNIVIFQVFD